VPAAARSLRRHAADRARRGLSIFLEERGPIFLNDDGLRFYESAGRDGIASTI
jgi:hypothetical protein